MPKSRRRKKKSVGQIANEALNQQLVQFVEKFGRPPRPGEPIFFDPSKDVPTPYSEGKMQEMQDQVVEAMRKVGIQPEIIYAYKKTGLLVMEGTPLSARDRKEWNDAIDEYFELERKAERDRD